MYPVLLTNLFWLSYYGISTLPLRAHINNRLRPCILSLNEVTEANSGVVAYNCMPKIFLLTWSSYWIFTQVLNFVDSYWVWPIALPTQLELSCIIIFCLKQFVLTLAWLDLLFVFFSHQSTEILTIILLCLIFFSTQIRLLICIFNNFTDRWLIRSSAWKLSSFALRRGVLSYGWRILEATQRLHLWISKAIQSSATALHQSTESHARVLSTMLSKILTTLFSLRGSWASSKLTRLSSWLSLSLLII